jgi:hypothetical protein
MAETKQTVLSDANGAFSLPVPAGINSITLNISAIGCKAIVHFNQPFGKIESIYLDLNPNKLADVSVKSLSARDVVRKAISSIPNNYADSGYFSFAFFREYQKVNNEFVNLIEMRQAVMFQLLKTGHEITAKEAYAILELRKTKEFPNPLKTINDDLYADEALFMNDDPVYHLAQSPFALSRLSDFRFHFDTSVRSGRFYVINYSSNTTAGESHGVQNYRLAGMQGEGYTTGNLFIDRESFAIKRIERHVKRYPGYSYYGKPNMILPELNFSEEFVSGDLIIEYAPVNGKWYLKKLYHQYTDQLFRSVIGDKAYEITDVFEWVSDSVSRYADKSLANKFYFKNNGAGYCFNKEFWNNVNFPFYFYPRDSVYKDLEKHGSVETQFRNSGIALTK